MAECSISPIADASRCDSGSLADQCWIAKGANLNRSTSFMGAAIGIGTAVGVAVGVATHDVAIGVGTGVALAVALATIGKKRPS
jgi:hypothetical protein